MECSLKNDDISKKKYIFCNFILSKRALAPVEGELFPSPAAGPDWNVVEWEKRREKSEWSAQKKSKHSQREKKRV